MPENNMTSYKKEKKNQIGKLTVILKSLLLAYIITGICLLILALLLYKMSLGEAVINIGIIVVYAVSSLVAGLFAGKCFGNRKFLWGLISGGSYFLLLLLVSVLLKENPKEIVDNLYTTFIICAGSGMLGGMLA